MSMWKRMEANWPPVCTWNPPTWTALSEIPSENFSQKWNLRKWMIGVKGVVYSIPWLDAQPLMLERPGGLWEFIWQSTEGRSKARILRMELPCMSERLRTINWQEAKILGRENNWGRRRVLEVLVMQQWRPMMNLDAGLMLDPLWTPLFAQEATVMWPEVLHQEVQPLPYALKFSQDETFAVFVVQEHHPRIVWFANILGKCCKIVKKLMLKCPLHHCHHCIGSRNTDDASLDIN